MIEYITEREYEARFEKWSKGRKPKEDWLAVEMWHAIERNAKYVGARIARKDVPRRAFWVGMLNDATEATLRREYREANIIANHQREGLISVYKSVGEEQDERNVIGVLGADNVCYSDADSGL